MKKDITGQGQKEQEIEFRKCIGKRKAEALIRLKEIICAVGEVVTLKGEDGASDLYISVLSKREKLREFLDLVERYRSEDEMYLDREAAALVSYLYDYLDDLQDFINVRHPHVPSYVTGVIVDHDIQMWSDEAERIVIRDMNAANTGMGSHSGDEWEAVKRRICDGLREKTALYDLHDLPEETTGETDAAWLEWIENFRKL